MSTRINGLIAAPYTPLNPDRSLNLAAVGPMAEFLHRNGVLGGFVCGSTGEGVSLTVDERKALAAEWAKTAPDGFRVMTHVGHTSIDVCTDLARHSASVGVSAIGAMSPYYFKPANVSILVDFCEEIAAAADVPFYYYHIPILTGVDLPMVEFLAEAESRIPTLAGLKFTHSNLMDFGLCMDYAGGKYEVLYGSDETFLAGLALGCTGAIGSSYNFAAPLYLRLLEAFRSGDLETARMWQAKSRALIRFVAGLCGSYNSVGKWIMSLLGIDCGPVRPPLPSLTPANEAAVREGLTALGFEEICCR